MKIEMGESLFYSWLRHVKECQLVQVNWKSSPSWQLHNEKELKQFMETTEEYFQNQYGYAIYKNNSFSQLLMQAEVDVLGISTSDDGMEVYGIDVAFHENGLNYGCRQETVIRIIKKLIRTALCIIGYFGVVRGELIFASPKIHSACINDLAPCITDINSFLLIAKSIDTHRYQCISFPLVKYHARFGKRFSKNGRRYEFTPPGYAASR